LAVVVAQVMVLQVVQAALQYLVPSHQQAAAVVAVAIQALLTAAAAVPAAAVDNMETALQVQAAVQALEIVVEMQ
jgi:hypothetical protein